MSGYSNRIVHLAFPELSEEDDPVWLSIKNPRYMAPEEIRPRDIAVGPDGKPVDNDAAQAAMYEMYAKMIVGWRAYDATTISVDQETGAELDMVRLPYPPTPELVAKLPMAIISRINDEMAEALNPHSDSASPTTKTLSLSPSRSTTVPGPAAASLGNSSTSS